MEMKCERKNRSNSSLFRLGEGSNCPKGGGLERSHAAGCSNRYSGNCGSCRAIQLSDPGAKRLPDRRLPRNPTTVGKAPHYCYT